MSRAAVERSLTWAMLLVLSVTLFGSGAGSAYAAPGDAADTGDAGDRTVGNRTAVVNEAGVTLPWSTMGLPSMVDLYGTGGNSFTMPVPAGLTAVRLRGSLHAPVNFAAGYLEIDDGEGAFLASVGLPPAGSAVAPFDIDISAAHVQASSVELKFTVRVLDDFDPVCHPVPRLTMSDLTTDFTGANLPATTIADFFAPVLQQVTIYAPTDAKPAEQQAVLTLVSTLARRYSARPLAIAVASQPRGAVPPPAPDLTRAVVVETGPPGLSIENAGKPDAYLRVSGDGDGLSSQVSMLGGGVQTLAQAAAGRVDKAGQDAALSGDTLTLSQLKVATTRTDTLGSNILKFGVDRTLLGSNFDSVQVHLLANYTPVNKDDAATVVIRSEGTVLYSASLDGSGVLDATLNLDRQLVDQHWINFDFELTNTPNQPCGPLMAPIAFQVDPRSTLTMHRGGPPPGGFSAFPYAFSPSFVVAFDGSGPGQLAYAAHVVAAVARTTQTELTPKVVDLQAAAESNSGALIVAKSKAVQQTSLSPPVSGDGSSINLASSTPSDVNIDGGLGSIQAFADPQRNRSVVLITTTTDWTLVDPLFSYIDGSTSDWSQLTGDVLAAGAGGTPTNVAIRPTDSVFEPTASSGSSSWLKIGIVGGGVLAAIAVLAVVLGLRRPKPVDVDD